MSDYAFDVIETSLLNEGFNIDDFTIEHDTDSAEYIVKFAENLDVYTKQCIDDLFAGQTWWYFTDNTVGITFREELSDDELVNRLLENQDKCSHFLFYNQEPFDFDELERTFTLMDSTTGVWTFGFQAKPSGTSDDWTMMFNFTREQLQSLDYSHINWSEYVSGVEFKTPREKNNDRKPGFLNRIIKGKKR